MQKFDREQFKVWLRLLAALTAAAVGVLSWLGGVSLVFLILRVSFAFLLIYGLSLGALLLFEHSGNQEAAAAAPEKGKFIDFAVGEQAEALPGEAYLGEEAIAAAGSGSGEPLQADKSGSLPGQVKADLPAGLPDSATQADIVRRMGWENSAGS